MLETNLTTLTGELLPYADKILVLANGKIEHDGSYDELVTSGVIDEAVSLIRETAVKDGVIETGASGLGGKAEEVTATPDDLSRATGDFAVYSYYLKSIGYQKAVVFVFFVVLYVFCATFSREFYSSTFTSLGPPSNQRPELTHRCRDMAYVVDGYRRRSNIALYYRLLSPRGI